MLYMLSRKTAILAFLFLGSVIPVSSYGFDYYTDPVTALSEIGFPEETQVRSSGIFRTHCGEFRILPRGTDPRTSCTLELEEGRLPILHYEMPCGEGKATVTAFASVMPRSKKVAYKASTVNLRDEFAIIKMRNMITFIRLKLHNRTRKAIDFEFLLPYILGTGIPMKVDYQSREYIFYDFKGRKYGILEGGKSWGEGKEVLFSCSDTLLVEGEQVFLKSNVTAGSTTEIYIYLPYFPMRSKDARRLSGKGRGESWESFYHRKKDAWNQRWNRTLSISIPEEKPLDLFYASQWYILETCLDHIGKRWILRANPFQYDQFYIRDGMHQVRALDLVGEHETAENCLDLFLESQTEQGRFASQEGQDDANGMALYALGQHYLLTRDEKWARKVIGDVSESVKWMEQYRRGGLFPPSRMRDNEQLKDARIVGHNLWGLAGLEAASDLARGAGREPLSHEWQSEARQFRSVLLREISKTCKKNGGFLSPSFEGMEAQAWLPGRYGLKYGFDWGNLALVYPTRVLKPDNEMAISTMTYFRRWYREGLFPYPERGYEDQLHHYLSMDITQTSLARGEYEQVLNDFYTGILLHTTNTQGGCERFDRRTRRFIPETNLTPHGAFAAKYIELFRNFFVREQGGILHLCSFLAPDWCGPGAKVRIDRAPTEFGRISFHLEFSDDGESAHLQIRPPYGRVLPSSYIFHMPPHLALTKAIVDGKSISSFTDDRVRLPSCCRGVDLFFERTRPTDVNYEKTVQKYRSGLIRP